MTSAANVGEGGLATPPTTPPALSRAQKLVNVLSLATQFSTCVEAFNLIHPSKDTDRAQKVALAKLGIQQGRLLIFGDAVGISSPPATIAKHMIPSHPGATNPDPTLPVNFGVRDPKLDDAGTNEAVRAALDEIEGRPSHLTREEMMERFGLKSPKSFKMIEHPALDTNRLEAFREKYALLQDLSRQMGSKPGIKRSMSIAMQHWTVKDVAKFDSFVSIVKTEVDGLITLMDVKDQVDRGMKSDIRTMGWHPDLSGPVVRQDWEKLRLIREACLHDYPEYVQATDAALKYINEELKGTSLAIFQKQFQQQEEHERRKSEEKVSNGTNGAKPHDKGKEKEKEKRPGWLSHFKFKSWHNKGQSKDAFRERSKSIANQASDQDPPRSMSEDTPKPGPFRTSEDANQLEPVRSKSLSALPEDHAPLNLDTRLESVKTADTTRSEEEVNALDRGPSAEANNLQQASTVNSLIDRHDMWKGVGRIETKDIRAKAHDWAT